MPLLFNSLFQVLIMYVLIIVTVKLSHEKPNVSNVDAILV